MRSMIGSAPLPSPRIWAGGDAVTGAAVVITAMGGAGGKKAAEGIHNYLQAQGHSGQKKAEGMS